MEHKTYPIPANEEQRLLTLSEYNLLDTPPTEDFDRLVELAARIFQVPIVLISLVARDRQFFKAHVGIGVCETSREVSFCAHALVQEEILFVPDALNDPRFYSNPLVLGPPFIRFYAGQQLVAPSGEKLGTVCLIDSLPRTSLSDIDRENLKDLAALIMDRMEMRRLEYHQTISQTRFENIAATSLDAIICTDIHGHITFWNKSANRLFGYSGNEVENKPSEIIVPETWRETYLTELAALQAGEKIKFADQTVELSGLHKDGTEFPAEFSFSTWDEGDSICIGAIVRDVTERRLNEKRLLQLASIDELSGLPNRSAWRTSLNETLSAVKPATILLIDIDSFKEINDTFGHSAGDAVIKEVALRLQSVCHNSIISARLGGDEFVTLLMGNDVQEASAIAERLLTTISMPFIFAGKSIEIGASIGISMSPMHGRKPEELLGAADLALYKAKAVGKGRQELFTPEIRELQIAQRAFELELRVAFEEDQFELFYQPQFDTRTRRLTGAEALIRWHHPSRGLLSPASFIDILSKKPSAAAVGQWILQTACEQAVKWRAEVPKFRIGVNLFEAQMRSLQLPIEIQNILNNTGLPADALELELVENILLHQDTLTLDLLHKLRSLGVSLAFDDYGTGFASLSLLKRYPVSRLKIDKSFVRDLATDRENIAVVKAIIYLANSFNLEVIAEGVETQSQLDFLSINNCAEVQGYLFGKPVPAFEFTKKFIRKRPNSMRGKA